MSSASSAAGLLNEIQMAEKDLAMYAAIIGRRPKLEPIEPHTDTAPIEEPTETPLEEESHSLVLESHEPRRISIWMRHVSHEARRRFDEAKMRLAS